MARINIDPSLDSDTRFQKLVSLTGDYDRVFGYLVRFWRIAIRHWGNDRSLVPFDEFDELPFAHLLLASRFAVKRDEGIYAAGSEERFDWYYKAKQSGRTGGIKSAQSRMAKKGTAIPDNARNGSKSPEGSLRSDRRNPSVPPNPLALALALAPQDKVNIETASNGHSPQNHQPPIGSPLATSPLKRIVFKATKATARVISTMQLIGNREQEAYKAIGEEAYGALLTKYPVNTWGQVCASYWEMAQRGKASFFEADLRRLFEAHFAEGEGCITSQASLPVAPGSRDVDNSDVIS